MLPLIATAHTELAYVHDYVENQMAIYKRDMDQKVLKIPKIPSLLEEKKYPVWIRLSNFFGTLTGDFP